MPRAIVVHLASNQQYWQASWRDEYRRRHKESIGPKASISRRQAAKRCQQIANRVNAMPRSSSTAEIPTLAAFTKAFLDSRTDIQPATRYLIDLTSRYLITCFGASTRIDRITREMAREWRNALARGDFSKGQPMAEVSVGRRCADAKGIFKRAVEDDILPFNPFDRLKVTAPKPDKNWHYVTMQQLDQLLTACRASGWKTLIALCRLAGLRRGEALALPWTCIDWHNRRLTVFAQKTGMKREVPIVEKLYTLLLEAFNDPARDEVQVCPISSHCLWRNFTVIRRHAGLPAWDDAFQVMRRNCETDWAQSFPQYAVSEWIGHDITVSAEFYLKVPEELFARAATESELNQSRLAPKLAPKSLDSS